MFSQVSYNVVVERFKAFAAGHYLIKRFSHGQIDVTDIMKDAEYPWMHIVPVSMNPSTGTRSFSFDIIFADLPRDKEDKTEYQRESLSDCIRLAEDLLAEIQNGNIIFGQDVELEDGASISPFMEEYTHVLTGVTLSLTMTFPWDWNACEIPSDWSAGGSGSGGTGGGGASLLLKTNGTPNIIQNILDLVDGTGMDIIDLGDGRVQFTSTGGGGTSAIGSIEFNPNHIAATGNPYTIGDIVYYLGSIYRCIATNDAILPTNATYWTLIATGYRIRQSPVDWNDTSGDYQILNKPTIPDVLDDLSDVKVPSPNDGEVLTYDTATGFWVSAPAPTASQGFQDVLIQDSVLTQANVIDASGFNFEIQDIYDLNLTGSYRGTIKSTIPSSDTTQGLEYGADFVKIECQNNTTSDYGQIQVNSQEIGISTQSGTDLTAINMSPTQIGIRTPNVVDGIASVGQVLTLQNATTGDVEYTSAGVGDMTKAVYDTDDDGVVDFAKAVKTKVRNSTGAVLHKGHIVYLSGSTGNVPNAVYAQANNDANSAQTFGVVYEDIPNNSNGFVVMLGAIDTLDTRTTAPNPFTSDTLVDGQVIYLSPTTAGHITNVKPSAPNHLVYVGYVIRTSPTNGTIEYRIQNGYELDELHDVSVLSPTSQDYLYYDGGTSLWKSKQLVASAITDSTDAGRNVLTIPNPSAITYLRINADNSISTLTAAQLNTALGFIKKLLNTTLTNTSSATYVNITDCIVSLEANSEYTGRFSLATGSTGAAGINHIFTLPTGATMYVGRYVTGGNDTTQTMNWSTITSGATLTPALNARVALNGFAEYQFYISTTNAGNFTPSFAPVTNGATATIYAKMTQLSIEKI
jgi:hypothetical protein